MSMDVQRSLKEFCALQQKAKIIEHDTKRKTTACKKEQASFETALKQFLQKTGQSCLAVPVITSDGNESNGPKERHHHERNHQERQIMYLRLKHVVSFSAVNKATLHDILRESDFDRRDAEWCDRHMTQHPSATAPDMFAEWLLWRIECRNKREQEKLELSKTKARGFVLPKVAPVSSTSSTPESSGATKGKKRKAEEMDDTQVMALLEKQLPLDVRQWTQRLYQLKHKQKQYNTYRRTQKQAISQQVRQHVPVVSQFLDSRPNNKQAITLTMNGESHPFVLKKVPIAPKPTTEMTPDNIERQSSSQPTASPLQTTGSPSQVTGSPSQVTGSPSQVTNSHQHQQPQQHNYVPPRSYTSLTFRKAQPLVKDTVGALVQKHFPDLNRPIQRQDVDLLSAPAFRLILLDALLKKMQISTQHHGRSHPSSSSSSTTASSHTSHHLNYRVSLVRQCGRRPSGDPKAAAAHTKSDGKQNPTGLKSAAPVAGIMDDIREEEDEEEVGEEYDDDEDDNEGMIGGEDDNDDEDEDEDDDSDDF